MSGSDIELALPPAPATVREVAPTPALSPTNQLLLPVASQPQPGSKLVCKNLLRGQTLAKAQADAADLFPKMLAQTSLVVIYGTDAFIGINRLADDLLKRVDRISIPEVSESMRRLNRRMRGIQRRYDVSDDRARRRYQGMRRRVLEALHLVGDFLDEFRQDITTVEQQLDHVIEVAEGKEALLLRYTTYKDEIYRLNEQEIKEVIRTIAVLEMVLDLAVKHAESIEVGDTAAGDRGEERKAEVAQLIERLKIKISDFKSRLFAAFATSMNVRMTREIDVTVAARLNYMVIGVIPLMKLILFQWQNMLKTMQAAELLELIISTSNEWNAEFYKASAVTYPRIQALAEQPAISRDTVLIMATALKQASDGIIEAINVGDQRRAELDAAMVQGRDIMSGAVTNVTDAILKSVVDPTIRPLEISESVPLPGSTN